MPACTTGLRRRIEAVDLHQRAPVPFGFVFQLADELAPTDIIDSLGKLGILHHVLHSQAFHAHHLVFVDDACGELMLIVSASISDTSMDTGYSLACFLSVLRAFFLPGMLPLGFCQFLLILG